MSGVAEVIGIIACVAGVISAYHDGGAIVERIKVKRAAKRAPPPPRLLEESIDQAPEEIEREKRRGIQRFGKAFEEGDHIAVIAIQRVTIELQGSLLERLRNAAFDDELRDFTDLVDQADLGRDRTITAMLELRQRLLQAAPISEMPATSPNGEVVQKKSPPIKSVSEGSPAPPPVRVHKTWTREYSSPQLSLSQSRDASGEEDSVSGADDTQSRAYRKRHSSLLGFLNRHHRSHSGGKEIAPMIQEGVQHSSTSPTSMPFRPPKHCDVSGQSLSGAAAQPDPEYTYQEWEDNPAEIWGSKPQGNNVRRDTVMSTTAPDAPNTSRLSPVSTETARSLADPNASQRSLQHLPSFAHSTASTAVPTPNPENDYLGFCKSAWKLQNGDRKAMQKCKEFNDGWSQSSVYYLACAHSKCAFAGHISVDKIWDKVWTVESKGIKFRWPFLAKSHVPQSRVKDHQYGYQCLFCVFLGEKSPVYFGTDTYLEHVQEHRSQPIGEVVLYKAKCIADRVTQDEDEFDINLFPLSAKEQVDRKKSEVLSDELLGFIRSSKSSPDAQDGRVTSNEPWNEGLSEFHWGGDMERVELE